MQPCNTLPHSTVSGRNTLRALSRPRNTSRSVRRRVDVSQTTRCVMDATAVQPAAPIVTEVRQLSLENDSLGRERVALSEVGWKKWMWRDHTVNFVQAGECGEPIVLIHGFGASAYHWRYNIPELAKQHRVYALDLLGFGFSEKAVTDYTGAQVWSDQVADFVREVVGEDTKVVLAGNSLGGFVSLATAARHPDMVKGLICLNSAGYFEDPNSENVEVDTEELNVLQSWWKSTVAAFQESVKRAVIMFSFYSTKSRVKQVLDRVYINTDSVDDELVRSILLPAEDKRAAEVFYRIISGTTSESRASVDSLLRELKVPLYLVWGDRDPWITPDKATKIMDLYSNSKKLGLDAGHCPQDEVPEQVNAAMLEWMATL
ncbi:hypothetical protein BSKO_07862 [Bryopsis sp. KO-2023]|nr:hypothetical protein BSKO_07862 [Bryopsis sp. KO-2023]